MDLSLFYYFTALSKYMNFSTAAEELYLSQSSLSKRIKSLETKLDMELFIRHPRTIELTEAGKAILPYAVHISNEYEMMKEALAGYTDGRSLLRIAAISFLSYYGMMNGISLYIKDNPGVNVNIKEINSQHGMELLDTDRVDACMMFSKLVSTDKYNKYPLVKDEMVAVMNENHPLAMRDTVTLEQLGNQELVLISERDEPFFKNFILDEFQKRDITPKIRAYGVWISAIWTIVKQSSSISVLPKKVTERIAGTGIVYRRIHELPEFHFSLITKYDYNKKVIVDFIRYIKNH